MQKNVLIVRKKLDYAENLKAMLTPWAFLLLSNYNVQDCQDVT